MRASVGLQKASQKSSIQFLDLQGDLLIVGNPELPTRARAAARARGEFCIDHNKKIAL